MKEIPFDVVKSLVEATGLIAEEVIKIEIRPNLIEVTIVLAVGRA